MIFTDTHTARELFTDEYFATNVFSGDLDYDAWQDVTTNNFENYSASDFLIPTCMFTTWADEVIDKTLAEIAIELKDAPKWSYRIRLGAKNMETHLKMGLSVTISQRKVPSWRLLQECKDLSQEEIEVVTWDNW